MKSKLFTPPNSVVLVLGSGDYEVPISMNNSVVAATSTCVAIGCMYEGDGPTKFTFSNGLSSDPDLILVFEGQLPTPNGVLSLQTVHNEVLLEHVVGCKTAKFNIYANDLLEPNRVMICVFP